MSGQAAEDESSLNKMSDRDFMRELSEAELV